MDCKSKVNLEKYCPNVTFNRDLISFVIYVECNSSFNF